jgi:hypothetical protein
MMFLLLLTSCGGGGGDDPYNSGTDQDPIPIPITEPILGVTNLGNQNYEIAIDFSALPDGMKFVSGQQAPNDAWISYSVSADGKLFINNWPGGYFEFSFGVTDDAGVTYWAEPVGQYVYPANVSALEQHFRVKLGEE